MDVDGTIKDGKIYMGQNGEVAKAFDIKDGCGISSILPELRIIPVVITARNSKIVENRCKELNIEELYQGSKNKLFTLNNLLEKNHSNLENVAYIGDDLPDIQCMKAVKDAGGLVLCPADAISEIRNIADFVSCKNGGNGAVRECIDYISSGNEER